MEIDIRRKYSEGMLGKLRDELVEAECRLNVYGCIYVTGSFGRLEASPHSDLDAFIGGGTSEKDHSRLISRLDEIVIKADLIKAVEALGLPKFDGDGNYLVHFTPQDLITQIGSDTDDARNTFTARLLLLLEGRALLGEDFFQSMRTDVIAAYWKDFPRHQNNFTPAYFANDTLRLWRTFCVNYEARTTDVTPEKKAKRRFKNFKLRYSRIVTTFSALLSFLSTMVEKETVTPTDAVHVFSLTPLDRIRALSNKHPKEVQAILDGYENFLAMTSVSEGELLEKFLSDEENEQMRDKSRSFANAVFQAVQGIGAGTELLTKMIV